MNKMKEIVDNFGVYVRSYEGFYIEEEVFISIDFLFYNFFESLEVKNDKDAVKALKDITEKFEDESFYAQKGSDEFEKINEETKRFIVEASKQFSWFMKRKNNARNINSFCPNTQQAKV